MSRKKKEKIPDELTILCPFCSAQWTAEMQATYWSASFGCPTCGDYTVEMTIEITCHNCKKVVYRKEIET